MSHRFVLDAWAILALLQQEEPAASRVRRRLESAVGGDTELFISIVNLGEVVYRIGKVKGKPEAFETMDLLRSLPLTVLPAEEEAVLAAVGYKTHHAISYVDAFAAAAAEAMEAVLVTGDPELAELEGIVAIEFGIRPCRNLEHKPRACSDGGLIGSRGRAG